MKRLILMSSGALVIAGAISAGLLLGRPSPLAVRVKHLEDEARRMTAENSRLQREVSRLQSLNTGLESRWSKATARRLPEANAGSAPGKSAPAQHYRVSRMEERLLEYTYGGLFSKLALNEAELAHFKQLLADRRNAIDDLRADITVPNLSPEQLSARAMEYRQKVVQVEQSSNAAIRHFLNSEEDYALFVEWTDSREERLHVTSAVPVFQAEGMPLSSEQREALQQLMSTVRKNRQPLPTGATQEDRLKQKDAEKLHILREAAHFLTPQQVETLKKTSIAVPR